MFVYTIDLKYCIICDETRFDDHSIKYFNSMPEFVKYFRRWVRDMRYFLAGWMNEYDQLCRDFVADNHTRIRKISPEEYDKDRPIGFWAEEIISDMAKLSPEDFTDFYRQAIMVLKKNNKAYHEHLTMLTRATNIELDKQYKRDIATGMINNISVNNCGNNNCKVINTPRSIVINSCKPCTATNPDWNLDMLHPIIYVNDKHEHRVMIVLYLLSVAISVVLYALSKIVTLDGAGVLAWITGFFLVIYIHFRDPIRTVYSNGSIKVVYNNHYQIITDRSIVIKAGNSYFRTFPAEEAARRTSYLVK